MGVVNSLKKGVWLEGFLLNRSGHLSVVLAWEKNTSTCCHGSLVSPETLARLRRGWKYIQLLNPITRHQHLPQREQIPHLPVYNFGKAAKYTNLAFLDSVVLLLANSS